MECYNEQAVSQVNFDEITLNSHDSDDKSLKQSNDMRLIKNQTSFRKNEKDSELNDQPVNKISTINSISHENNTSPTIHRSSSDPQQTKFKIVQNYDQVNSPVISKSSSDLPINLEVCDNKNKESQSKNKTGLAKKVNLFKFLFKIRK